MSEASEKVRATRPDGSFPNVSIGIFSTNAKNECSCVVIIYYDYTISILLLHTLTSSNLITNIEKVVTSNTWWGKHLQTHVELVTFSHCLGNIFEVFPNKPLNLCILRLESHAPLVT